MWAPTLEVIVRLTIAIIVLMLCAATVTGAMGAPAADERGGSLGLLFSFDGLALQSIAGGIGAKYWMSERWAAVGSVDFGYSHTNAGSSDADNTLVGITAGLQRHLTTSRISPYVGLGAGYSYWTIRSESNSSSAQSTTNRHILSADINLGVEFWLAEGVSLAGQYGLEGRYVDENRESNDASGSTTESDVKRTTLEFGTTRVFVSAYF
jgi:opacity protein-like surface antigen